MGYVMVGLSLVLASGADATVINFDTTASGSPLAAPTYFSDTTPLTTLYSSLGATFSGPTSSNGGAILNQTSNFSVNARSGVNFLAFNRASATSNGGIPTDPETITFATPQASVSIWASGGSSTPAFTMTAFNSANVIIGSSTVVSPPNAYAQLAISQPGITKVTLVETPGSAFVYDDLQYTPEPSTAAVGIAAGVIARRRRR